MEHLMMDSKGWPYDSFDCLSYSFKSLGIVFRLEGASVRTAQTSLKLFDRYNILPHKFSRYSILLKHFVKELL